MFVLNKTFFCLVCTVRTTIYTLVPSAPYPCQYLYSIIIRFSPKHSTAGHMPFTACKVYTCFFKSKCVYCYQIYIQNGVTFPTIGYDRYQLFMISTGTDCLTCSLQLQIQTSVPGRNRTHNRRCMSTHTVHATTPEQCLC